MTAKLAFPNFACMAQGTEWALHSFFLFFIVFMHSFLMIQASQLSTQHHLQFYQVELVGKPLSIPDCLNLENL